MDNWLADGKAARHSARTLGNRRHLMQKFVWWLVNEEEVEPSLESVTRARVRSFLAYLGEDRTDGRFGSESANTQTAASTSTIHTYYRCLRAFLNFCVAEGMIDDTPMKNVKVPRIPNDQIQPFSGEQVQALVNAARGNRAPERDAAIILLLFDTGMRVSELCGLKVGDVDRTSGELTVIGKGNKRRQVFMAVAARHALWRHMEKNRAAASAAEPLFVGIGGNRAGTGMTPSGVFQTVQAAGKKAGVGGVRCSPHTLRHAFAIEFLRGGGSVLALQKLLGHEALEMVRRYVALADSDLAQAHRSASPADRLGVR